MDHGNINAFFETFNNREIAMAIWGVIAFGTLLFLKQIRISFFKLIGTLFDKKLLKIHISAVLYVMLVILLFYKVGIWNIELLKTSIIWFLGTGMVLIFTYEKLNETDYVKKIFRKTFAWTLILEFIVGFSSFSLVHELILVPCMIVLSLLTSYSKTKKEYRPIYRLLNPIFNITILFIIFWALVHTIKQYKNAFTINNLLELLLAPVLTIMLIPYVYLLAVYIGYESIFKMQFFRGGYSEADQSIIKKAIFKSCHLKLKNINYVAKNIYKVNVRNNQILKRFLNNI